MNDSYIQGTIELDSILTDDSRKCDKEIVIEGCIVECFEGNAIEFLKPVTFKNSYFKDCQFLFSYFIGGLIIEGCTFEKYLDFQAGGHNQPGYPITIRDNAFLDFVNFFDCIYWGELIVRNNNFLKGTNIQSKTLFITFFEIAPDISGNSGKTDIESEMPEY